MVIALVGAAIAVALSIKFVFRNSHPIELTEDHAEEHGCARRITIHTAPEMVELDGNERLERSTQSVGDSPEEHPSDKDAPPTD